MLQLLTMRWFRTFCLLLLTTCSAAESPPTTQSGETPCRFDFSDNATGTSAESRSFYMGFTTWPYAAESSAQEQIYTKLKDSAYADIVGLHYMDGIPWVYGDDAVYNPVDLYPFYPAALQDYINARIEDTVGAGALYISLDQGNDRRTAIAKDYFTGTAPAFSFADSRAKNAFTNFVLVILWRAYETYNNASEPLPKVYLNLSNEMSDLIVNEATDNGTNTDYPLWRDALDMISFVSPQLSGFAHTDSTFQTFVRDTQKLASVALKSPKDTTANNETSDPSEAIEKQFPDIHPYLDMVGISVYPYIFYNDQFTGHPDPLRADPAYLESNSPSWLSQGLDVIGGSLPMGITETGWIAEDYDVLMDGSYVIQSTAQRQKAYLELLLSELNSNSRWKFLMWFTMVDFDPLWGDWDSDTQLFGLTWRDAGLFSTDANSNADYLSGCTATARPAWTTWSRWVSRNNSLGL